MSTTTTTSNDQCHQCKRWFHGPRTFHFFNGLGPYCEDCYDGGVTFIIRTAAPWTTEEATP